MKSLLVVLSTTLVLTMGCQRQEVPAEPAEAPPPAPPPAPTEITGEFSTPESVLYDAEQDVYFISNINGEAPAADDNGFIARVNAETLQVETKWIDGSKPEVTLNAPKGMAIIGDDLYVSDITTVRKFDRRTGASKGEVRIAGSTFLNDVASEGNTVYVSDSGLKAGASGFEPTGTDAVWSITNNRPTRLVRGRDLNRPNGLAVSGGKVWVVTFGAKELFPIEQGKKGAVTQLPNGTLDGLVALADGSFLVSSWDAKAVYKGTAGGQFQAIVENVDAPADLGFDTKRNRIVVPHFMQNRVSLHPLPE